MECLFIKLIDVESWYDFYYKISFICIVKWVWKVSDKFEQIYTSMQEWLKLSGHILFMSLKDFSITSKLGIFLLM